MMVKITLDNNCLISLHTHDRDAPPVREILNQQRRRLAQVFVPAIAASENQQGGRVHATFSEFEKFPRDIGCDECSLLSPLGYWDVTYRDHSVYGPSEMEGYIHKILFPRMAFSHTDYVRTTGIALRDGEVDKKWRRAKCDVLAMWCHIHYGNDIFVTSDANFHKATKKPRLLALGAKEILRPAETVEKIGPR